MYNDDNCKTIVDMFHIPFTNELPALIDEDLWAQPSTAIEL